MRGKRTDRARITPRFPTRNRMALQRSRKLYDISLNGHQSVTKDAKSADFKIVHERICQVSMGKRSKHTLARIALLRELKRQRNLRENVTVARILATD